MTDGDNSGLASRGSWTLRRQVLAAEPHAEAVRVLAIDGGGIRGIIPTVFLRELERRTGKRTAELFELVSGTSTGAIIALGVTVPGADGRAKWTADDGVRFYEEQGPNIFTRTRMESIRSLGNVLHEKFHSRPLEDALQTVFGETKLRDALVDVLVPTYNVVHRDVHFFSRRRAREEGAHDTLMRVVARAATAAPTFFEPALVDLPMSPSPVLVDGAVFANNPAMCAFAEAEKQQLGTDVVLISLGTGDSDVDHAFDWEVMRAWGLAHWARPLLQMLHDGGAQAVDFQLKELLGPERYHRFQALGVNESMDDGRPETIARLREHGENLVARHDREIDHVCTLLVR